MCMLFYLHSLVFLLSLRLIYPFFFLNLKKGGQKALISARGRNRCLNEELVSDMC
jgi:hypothetical protein